MLEPASVPAGDPARPDPRRVRLAFFATFAGLAAATILVVATPLFDAHVHAPTVDLVLDTVATVTLGLAATLAWVRFRTRREAIALYQAAAFTLLAAAYTSAVAISLADDAAHASTDALRPVSDVIFAIGRLGAGVVLVIGGLPARLGGSTRPVLLALLVGIAAMALALGTQLASDAALLRPVDAGAGETLPHITPLGAAVQLAAAAVFMGAAVLGLRHWERERMVVDAWIAVGLVIAGFAEIHGALYPAGHPGQTSSADLLRLVFFVVLLLGIEAEARAVLTRVQIANDEIARLHEAAIDRAAAEERARLARELHDGLAQDLWLAKLKIEEVASAGALPPATARLVDESRRAVDVGLADARQALIALRLADEPGSGFFALLARYVDDFEDRFGLRVELHCSGNDAVLAPRTQAELLRIAQEALTNVRQHAEASVVGVRVLVRGGRVHVRIADNGCGFELARSRPASFGLRAMRERAELIEARLRIASRPGEGTTIRVSAPATTSATGRRWAPAS